MENFTILLKKYADFIVRVGVNPQPGQTLVINCCLEAAPLARLCVRSAYEAGARDVLVNWSDNDVSRSRMELGSEEALSDFKSWQLRRYLDYAESAQMNRTDDMPNPWESIAFFAAEMSRGLSDSPR